LATKAIPKETYRVDGTTKPTGSVTVLVVDDEEGVREVSKRILQFAGFSVLVATGGSGAIELICERGDEIDVLITDIFMPVVLGTSVAEVFENRHPGKPVIFMSGQSRSSIEAALGRSVQVVEKPFDETTLVSAVMSVVDANMVNMEGCT
jgi:DNA-binding NtrC family response regulator